MKNWLPFLTEIAEITDQIALANFASTELAVEAKDDGSPVSNADQEIENIVRELADRHPEGLAVFGEEQGAAADSGLRLIVDPIDATRNFIRGVPLFATLLAIEQDKKIVAGLISAPAMGMRWQAELGGGAYHINRQLKDGKPHRIAVSSCNRLEQAQLYHGSLAGNEVTPQQQSALLKVIEATARQRGVGDFYQHSLVAQGAGEMALDPAAEPWDIAALKIIIEEAGGRLTSFSGEDSIYSGSALSTNGLLHQEVLALLGG